MAGGDFSLPKARPSGPPYFSRNQIAAALHQVAGIVGVARSQRVQAQIISKRQ